MTVAVAELEANIGKQVVLHLKQEDGSLKELEGKLEAASAAGLAFKEKGKSNLDLYMPDQVESLQAAPDKPKSVSQKKIKPIVEGQARQHLLDRHGVPLDWAKKASEKEAFEYHKNLDHSNLGHVHVEPEQTDRDKALADDTGASDGE